MYYKLKSLDILIHKGNIKIIFTFNKKKKETNKIRMNKRKIYSKYKN